MSFHFMVKHLLRVVFRIEAKDPIWRTSATNASALGILVPSRGMCILFGSSLTLSQSALCHMSLQIVNVCLDDS